MNEQEQKTYTELLVIRCQLGEKEAFELMVKLWQKPLVVFASRYLGQEIDAEDVVQKTWIAVIKRLNKLQNPSLFVGWLFRILTNKCIDKIRKEKSELDKIEQVNTRAESLETSNESESLNQAIRKLSDEQKILIMLRFEQGLQIGHIAAILNMAEGTVKSRLHRGLVRLREILGNTL